MDVIIIQSSWDRITVHFVEPFTKKKKKKKRLKSDWKMLERFGILGKFKARFVDLLNLQFSTLTKPTGLTRLTKLTRLATVLKIAEMGKI